jgi:hypothetical protein
MGLLFLSAAGAPRSNEYHIAHSAASPRVDRCPCLASYACWEVSAGESEQRGRTQSGATRMAIGDDELKQFSNMCSALGWNTKTLTAPSAIEVGGGVWNMFAALRWNASRFGRKREMLMVCRCLHHCACPDDNTTRITHPRMMLPRLVRQGAPWAGQDVDGAQGGHGKGSHGCGSRCEIRTAAMAEGHGAAAHEGEHQEPDPGLGEGDEGSLCSFCWFWLFHRQATVA